jgi:hypothetical protein
MLQDSISLSTREITPEGYLKAKASITCVGIQDYYGIELAGSIDTPVIPGKVYSVFRPPETVFHDTTIETAKLKPVTDDHPTVDVDANNNRNLAIGNMGESVTCLNDTELCLSIIITDAQGVKKIEAGTHQLSSGYVADLKVQTGIHKGKSYDMIFSGPMVINHIALLEKGRCDSGARILDNRSKSMTDDKVKSRAKALVKSKAKIEDFDMESLLAQVAQKVMPDIQKMIQSDDFVSRLAEVIGNSLSASYNETSTPDIESGDTVDGDLDTPQNGDTTDEDISGDTMDAGMNSGTADEGTNGDMVDDDDMLAAPGSNSTTDSRKVVKRTLKKTMADAVNTRVSVIMRAKKINPDVKTNARSNRAILLDALHPIYGEKIKRKSFDYLQALVDGLSDKRDAAGTYFEQAKTGGNNRAQKTPKNGIELRRILDRYNSSDTGAKR